MNVPLIVCSTAVVMIVVELFQPGRTWPKVSGWWLRALLVNGIQAAIVFLAGILWDPWMKAHRPWNLDGLGPATGALIGYGAVTFVYYWWHRWRHTVPFLWRWFHQFHHSPARIEIITSFYKHPFEIVANGLLSSAILYLGCGLGPEAAVWTVLMTGLAELFYHWNVRTPYWLGFFFQRPESHCVHHEQGVHHFNYADLPLWDMMFGTFKNPRKTQFQCGLGHHQEQKLGSLLMGRDLEVGS